VKNIALQLYSIKELTEVDFFGTLEKVAQIGYKGVEFAGYFNAPAKELKACLDNFGLKAAGSHVPINLLSNNLDEVIEYSQQIDNKFIICPYLPLEMRDSKDKYLSIAEELNKIGEKIKGEGMHFGYHNHDFELDIFDGEHGLDLLFMNSDTQNLFVELDTFWVEYSGNSSIDFIEKYKERVKILHIKEMKSAGEKKNTEIGKGIIDFKTIIGHANKFNTEWFTVEQEYFEIPQLESIKVSFDYLSKILS
jgi:sugar phosphate isomerase/epimerase